MSYDLDKIMETLDLLEKMLSVPHPPVSNEIKPQGK
jgi:hypothetical protein